MRENPYDRRDSLPRASCTRKEALGAIVGEDGKDLARHLQWATLAHNSTPPIAMEFSPFFSEHRREAAYPPMGTPAIFDWIRSLLDELRDCGAQSRLTQGKDSGDVDSGLVPPSCRRVP